MPGGIDLPPLIQEIKIDTSDLERPVPATGLEKTASEIDKKMISIGRTMSRVGGTLTRYVTIPLAGMGFMFTKAFSDAAKAGDPASQRIMAQWEQLRQKFGQVSVVVAQTLAPAIERAVNTVTRLADRFLALPRGAQSLIIFGALGAAALGPLIGTVGRLTAGIGYVIRLFQALPAIVGSTMASTFTSMGPVGWILLAITGAATLLVGAFTLLWRYSEAFRNALHGVGEIIRARIIPIIKNFVHALINVLRPVFERIGRAFGDMVEKVRKWLDDNREKINHWAAVAIAAFRLTVEFAIAVLWPALKTVFGNIAEIIGLAIRSIQNFFKILSAGGGAIAKFVQGDIVGAVQDAWKAGDAILSIGEDIAESVKDIVERNINAAEEIGKRVGEVVDPDHIKQVFEESKVDLFADSGEGQSGGDGGPEVEEAPIPAIGEPIYPAPLPPASLPGIEIAQVPPDMPSIGKFEAAAKDMSEAAKEQKKAAESIQIAMSRSGRTIEINGLLVREPPEAIREWFHDIARAASL